MAHEQGGEQAQGPGLAEGAHHGYHDLVKSVPGRADPGGSESVTTVLVALGVNGLVAVASRSPPW